MFLAVKSANRLFAEAQLLKSWKSSKLKDRCWGAGQGSLHDLPMSRDSKFGVNFYSNAYNQNDFFQVGHTCPFFHSRELLTVGQRGALVGQQRCQPRSSSRAAKQAYNWHPEHHTLKPLPFTPPVDHPTPRHATHPLMTPMGLSPQRQDRRLRPLPRMHKGCGAMNFSSRDRAWNQRDFAETATAQGMAAARNWNLAGSVSAPPSDRGRLDRSALRWGFGPGQ